MVVEIIMPKLGETMEKGKIIKWIKKEGDKVEKGEPILEIETEKAVLQVEARGSGILKKMLAREGDIVPATRVIGYIVEEGEELPEETAGGHGEAAAFKPQTYIVAAETETQPQRMAEVEIKATPLARKIAREKGVDLTQVAGTGPGGRITERDVLQYVAAREAAAVAAFSAPAQVTAMEEEFQIAPILGMRKAIARKMAYSKTTIPHFYISVDVDMTEAAKMRESLMPIIEAKTGLRLSYTHMLIKAAAMALKEFPHLNALCDGENIKISKSVNIGIAVGLEDGLIVPVLRNAEAMNLIQIVSKTEDLITKAKAKKLSEDEFTGGTFTISNMGMFDVDSFTAIINPPETAILAVGKIKDKPVVVDGEIKVRKIMTLTLSADHRVVDGVSAAKFLGRIKSILENPCILLLPE